MEKQINEKVMEIALSVHKTIPVAWENLFINITLAFDGGEVYYFFNEEVKSDYMYNPGTKKSNMMDNRYLKGAISVGGISFILLVAMVLNALFNKTEKED